MDIIEGLDESQKEAVTFPEGPLLIVAGAGTGKTTVITRRIAYLINRKMAKPEEILALTFTDKAAQEMEERVDALIPYGYTEIWISTFHAFGDRVLRENALEAGLSPDFQVLTKPEQTIFFKEHLFEFPLRYYRPLGNPIRWIDALLKLISRAKDEDVSPEEYLKYAQELKRKAEENPQDKSLKEEAEREYEVAKTYEVYQRLMAEHHYIDFGDQVLLTLKLFREHPLILEEYQKRFRYILVDEFQDTNYAQFQLVKLLAAKHRNITVVGDDDQSIYKFRGAAISNILNFMETYKDAHQIVLKKNYRSYQPLLDASYRLIRYNNPDRLEEKNRIDKRLISVKGEGGVVKYLSYDTVFSEADGVARMIQDKVEKGEYSYKDFAILVRRNKDADPFLRSLNMLSIPWKFTGAVGLYEQEEIRLLINFLRVISDHEDSTSLFHLASSEIYNLDPETLIQCNSLAKRRNRSLWWVFSHIDGYEDFKGEEIKTIKRIVEDIRNYTSLSLKKSTGEVLYKFLYDTGYLNSLVSRPSLRNEEKVKNTAKFFDIIQRTSKVLTHNRVREFIDYLNMLIEAGDDPSSAEVETEEDAVSILTVHKAKGLEFPVVFMVSLIKDCFPTRFKKEEVPLPEALVKDILPSGDYHYQEERRLFYVGMTRAKEELYLTSAEDYGGKRQRRLSPFVAEALDLSPSQITPYKSSSLEIIKRNRPKIITEPKSPYIPPSQLLYLSYWQIDDYLTCPLKYKYVHILHLPVMRHHAVVYGAALHSAIQRYFKERLRGYKVSLDDLLRFFEEAWVSEGFLSPEHERIRFEKGKEVLKSFYERAENERLPTYVEKEFNFQLGNTRVRGRWDRIDEYDGEVRILDYKSSEVKTKEEADKETKRSIQLSIYSLAYREIYKRLPDKVELYFLESGIKGETEKTEKDMERAIKLIEEVSVGIRAQDYTPKPNDYKCAHCAYEHICSKGR